MCYKYYQKYKLNSDADNFLTDEFDNVVATIEISGDLLNDPRVAKVVNAVDSALAIWTLKTECSLRWRPLKEIAYVTIE